MIKVTSLTVQTAESRELVSSVSLVLDQGKTLGVYGPNGSGKSTLLRALAGVSRVRSLQGEVWINHLRITPGMDARERVRQVIYLGSDFETPFELKVHELLEFGARVENRSPSEIAEVVERLRIEQFLNRDFKSLSDGEKQLMMFARALIQRPRVIIFDESFSKLDLDKLILVAKTLRSHVARGYCVVVASHDLNFITEFADMLLFLKSGKKIAGGSVSHAFNRATLEELYPEVALQIVTSPETGRMKVLY